MSKNERDDFWDVEKLLPKKSRPTLPPFSTKEKVFEVQIPEKEDSASGSDGKSTTLTISKDGTAADEIKYSLSDGLVRSVTIKRIADKFDFYGNFRKAALLYYDVKAEKCEFAPFFSYMPQYSQFTTVQKNYYFYWRDMLRRGKYIKTDYSYLYLYIYEVLNLPDIIPAERGLEILVDLWAEYRSDLPSIDSNMTLWVQDYCFVHRLKCPIEKIRPFIFEAISSAEFKEFYLCDIAKMGNDGVAAMLAYLSDYDWRKSKFARGENEAVFTSHLLGAMRLLISELWESGEIFSTEGYESAVIKRSAFRGSLCTHSVKCRLEIEYLPLSKAEDLKRRVTAAIKYTENKLRALLGVKSRLATKDLPDGYRVAIDKYFISLFEKADRERRRAQMPEYERLYDAVSSGLSIGGADEIEQASWTTTLRLVEDTEDEEADVIIDEKENRQENSEQNNGSNSDRFGLNDEHVKFVSAALNADFEAMYNLSESLGLPMIEIASVINEAFSDGFGDIVLCENDGVFEIIEDYREDIEEWLTK